LIRPHGITPNDGNDITPPSAGSVAQFHDAAYGEKARYSSALQKVGIGRFC